jgi:hypothetical protein
MSDPLKTVQVQELFILDEFDSYDYDELLSDTNYNNSHLTNQDDSEFDWEIYKWLKESEEEQNEQENEKAKEK